MKTKILSVIAAASLAVTSFAALTITASAEEVKEGVLTFDTDTGAITKCDSSASGDLVIPSEINGVAVTGIGEYAFKSNTNLTSVSIPEGVTSIGREAFRQCTGLTSITIPDSITSIGGGAFFRCTSLTSITIPEGVTSIGGYTFDWCSGLTSITIPEGVTSIDEYAFGRLTGLTSINYAGTEEQWNSITKSELWNYKTTADVNFLGETTDPTATYKQEGEYYGSGDDVASLWTVTVTPGSDTIESLNVKVNDKSSNEGAWNGVNITSGTVQFAVAVNLAGADVSSVTAVVNGDDVTTTLE